MDRIGESILVHILSSFLVERVPPSSSNPCCVFPAVVPLVRAVVPLDLDATLLLSSGGTAASGRWYRHLTLHSPAAVVPAMYRPCTGQGSVLMRWLGGGGPVGPVDPFQPVQPEVRAVLPLVP